MTEGTPDRKLNAALARMKKHAAERAVDEVLQLPLWPEPKRGTPNSFIRSALFSAIQSKDRTFIKSATLASQEGITVKFTGEQLNQEDLTLWETLVHLAKTHPLGNLCSFTAYGILKELDLHTGGDEHRRLHEGITRLQACSVQVTHENKTYFGPLIKSGVKDELTAHYTIELNRELIRLYGESQWTAIDWQQRKQLRRKPLAQALHAYFSSHRQPFPVSLAFLRRITGSKTARLAEFKRSLRAALEELITIGFLLSYNFEGDKVAVQRQPAVALPRR